MRKISFSLTEEQLKELEAIRSKGKLRAMQYKKITAIIALSQGKQQKDIAKELNVSAPSLKAWLENYKEIGIDFLYDKERAGRPKRISAEAVAKILALASGPAPEGQAEWTLRTLANKVVELGLVKEISHMTIQRILKKGIN